MLEIVLKLSVFIKVPKYISGRVYIDSGILPGLRFEGLNWEIKNQIHHLAAKVSLGLMRRGIR